MSFEECYFFPNNNEIESHIALTMIELKITIPTVAFFLNTIPNLPRTTTTKTGCSKNFMIKKLSLSISLFSQSPLSLLIYAK